MSKGKILIVDDEREINDLIKSYIIKEGYLVFSAYDGKTALSIIDEESPDLIILDIMLPDIDGTDLSLLIRKKSNASIIFLSCKSEEMDKIIALAAGGDDYMTKPFMPGELVARIKAHLRRQKTSSISNIADEKSQVYEYPGLEVNLLTRNVIANDKKVNLTAKEFDVLKLLLRNPRRIFTPEQIYEYAWKMGSLEGDSRTVMVYISNLRKKIEKDPGNPKLIVNIYGVGYKFNDEFDS